LAVRHEQWRHVGAWLRPQTLQGKVALSLIVHLVALFFVFNAWWFGARRLRPSGTVQGVKTMEAYVPGKAPPSPQQRRVAKPLLRHPNSLTLKTAPPETLDDAAAAVSSNEAFGNDPVSIARVEGFPQARPNLSGVGQTADLIVDVEIDDTGHVTQVHQRKGIGTDVDAIVLATVEQWLFHPAQREGKPISSRREIHFHFDRSRNPAGCGWDCFALAAD
jgi:protein TonB